MLRGPSSPVKAANETSLHRGPREQDKRDVEDANWSFIDLKSVTPAKSTGAR